MDRAELAEAARRYYHSGNRERKIWLDRTKRRALQRLADEYPKRYEELLAEERRTGDPMMA